MDRGDHIWVGLTALFMSISMCAWVLASESNVGSPPLYWGAGTIFVIALAGLIVRAVLKSKGKVRTDDMREEQRRLAKQQLWQIAQVAVPTVLLFALSKAQNNLLNDNTLPQWLGVMLDCLLVLAFFANLVWIWWVMSGRSRSRQSN